MAPVGVKKPRRCADYFFLAKPTFRRTLFAAFRDDISPTMSNLSDIGIEKVDFCGDATISHQCDQDRDGDFTFNCVKYVASVGATATIYV